MFVHELYVLWPFVCGNSTVYTAYKNRKFANIFKGTAASSFRALVQGRGFDESTYPYKKEGSRVLAYWNGSNFHKEGNNLPNNVRPCDKCEISHEVTDIDLTEYSFPEEHESDDEDVGNNDNDESAHDYAVSRHNTDKDEDEAEDTSC